jgi:hypothetical protein
MTQDEIIELALKVDLMGHELAYSDWYKNRLKAFGKLVAEKEREACAKVCEELVIEVVGNSALAVDQCARAIRARGQA